MDKRIDKVYFWVYGGFGDCLSAYRTNREGRGSNSLNKVRWIKENFPRSKTAAIVLSGNEQSIGLFNRNKDFDICKWHPTPNINVINHRVRSLIRSLAPAGFTDANEIEDLADKPSFQNKIVLTKKEKDLAKTIINDKTIIFHPFASIQERRVLEPKNSKIIVDEIIGSGFNVVVVGHSYMRRIGNTAERILEEWHYNRPGLTNLVNHPTLSNPLVASLITQARAIIGNWSYCTSSAFYENKPSMVFIDETRIKFLNKANKRKPCKGEPRAVSVIENNTVTKDLQKFLSKI